MIFLLISQYRTTLLNNPQQSSPRTKNIMEPLLIPHSLELSKNLLLIEAQLLFWNPLTKYIICSMLKSPLTTPSWLTTFCSTLEDSIDMAKKRKKKECQHKFF